MIGMAPASCCMDNVFHDIEILYHKVPALSLVGEYENQGGPYEFPFLKLLLKCDGAVPVHFLKNALKLAGSLKPRA